ncbi:Smad nuclear-interacting protein 1 [Babesia caballi]|uniref:Smad nuclear-interacting protein 1 n=1 Tax=Babesia caballi TaxID=5871 RepID=A0AAV4LU34_BABCB|nr:Smad nuclear-interacting protein 1 [Babesia caballi]
MSARSRSRSRGRSEVRFKRELGRRSPSLGGAKLRRERPGLERIKHRRVTDHYGKAPARDPTRREPGILRPQGAQRLSKVPSTVLTSKPLPTEVEKPNFEPSGLLAGATNERNGVALKVGNSCLVEVPLQYTPPPESRLPQHLPRVRVAVGHGLAAAPLDERVVDEAHENVRDLLAVAVQQLEELEGLGVEGPVGRSAAHAEVAHHVLGHAEGDELRDGEQGALAEEAVEVHVHDLPRGEVHQNILRVPVAEPDNVPKDAPDSARVDELLARAKPGGRIPLEDVVIGAVQHRRPPLAQAPEERQRLGVVLRRDARRIPRDVRPRLAVGALDDAPVLVGDQRAHGGHVGHPLDDAGHLVQRHDAVALQRHAAVLLLEQHRDVLRDLHHALVLPEVPLYLVLDQEVAHLPGGGEEADLLGLLLRAEDLHALLEPAQARKRLRLVVVHDPVEAEVPDGGNEDLLPAAGAVEHAPQVLEAQRRLVVDRDGRVHRDLQQLLEEGVVVLDDQRRGGGDLPRLPLDVGVDAPHARVHGVREVERRPEGHLRVPRDQPGDERLEERRPEEPVVAAAHELRDHRVPVVLRQRVAVLEEGVHDGVGEDLAGLALERDVAQELRGVRGAVEADDGGHLREDVDNVHVAPGVLGRRGRAALLPRLRLGAIRPVLAGFARLLLVRVGQLPSRPVTVVGERGAAAGQPRVLRPRQSAPVPAGRHEGERLQVRVDRRGDQLDEAVDPRHPLDAGDFVRVLDRRVQRVPAGADGRVVEHQAEVLRVAQPVVEQPVQVLGVQQNLLHVRYGPLGDQQVGLRVDLHEVVEPLEVVPRQLAEQLHRLVHLPLVLQGERVLQDHVVAAGERLVVQRHAAGDVDVHVVDPAGAVEGHEQLRRGVDLPAELERHLGRAEDVEHVAHGVHRRALDQRDQLARELPFARLVLAGAEPAGEPERVERGDLFQVLDRDQGGLAYSQPQRPDEVFKPLLHRLLALLVVALLQQADGVRRLLHEPHVDGVPHEQGLPEDVRAPMAIVRALRQLGAGRARHRRAAVQQEKVGPAALLGLHLQDGPLLAPLLLQQLVQLVPQAELPAGRERLRDQRVRRLLDLGEARQADEDAGPGHLDDAVPVGPQPRVLRVLEQAVVDVAGFPELPSALRGGRLGGALRLKRRVVQHDVRNGDQGVEVAQSEVAAAQQRYDGLRVQPDVVDVRAQRAGAQGPPGVAEVVRARLEGELLLDDHHSASVGAARNRGVRHQELGHGEQNLVQPLHLHAQHLGVAGLSAAARAALRRRLRLGRRRHLAALRAARAGAALRARELPAVPVCEHLDAVEQVEDRLAGGVLVRAVEGAARPRHDLVGGLPVDPEGGAVSLEDVAEQRRHALPDDGAALLVQELDARLHDVRQQERQDRRNLHHRQVARAEERQRGAGVGQHLQEPPHERLDVQHGVDVQARLDHVLYGPVAQEARAPIGFDGAAGDGIEGPVPALAHLLHFRRRAPPSLVQVQQLEDFLDAVQRHLQVHVRDQVALQDESRELLQIHRRAQQVGARPLPGHAEGAEVAGHVAQNRAARLGENRRVLSKVVRVFRDGAQRCEGQLGRRGLGVLDVENEGVELEQLVRRDGGGFAGDVRNPDGTVAVDHG